MEPLRNLHNQLVVMQKTMPFYKRNWSDIAFNHSRRTWRYKMLLHDDDRWKLGLTVKQIGGFGS